MITPEKIEEWIRELEERPGSAPEILRLVASRLKNLTRRNQELLDENILLRSDKKVEEYEARITSLEYQLGLLKRQLGGEAAEPLPSESAPLRTISLLVYNRRGEIMRLELDPAQLTGRVEAGRLILPAPGSQESEDREEAEARRDASLLAAGSHEELLFLFSSGRTISLAAESIPAQTGRLDWKLAHLEEPRGGEELAVVVPVGRMGLADSIVQVSRRGCVKRMMRRSFEGFVAAGFVGAGIKINTDRACDLSLLGKDDRLALISQEGYALSLDPARLPYSVEESMRLSPTDHVVSAFPVGGKKLLLFITRSGKVISRETGWLAAPASLRSRGQSIFSAERRQAGTRLAGAAPADENDWAALLDASGALAAVPVSDLLGSGSVFNAPSQAALTGFSIFRGPREVE